MYNWYKMTSEHGGYGDIITYEKIKEKIKSYNCRIDSGQIQSSIIADKDYPIDLFLNDVKALHEIIDNLNSSTDKFFFVLSVQIWNRVIRIHRVYKANIDNVTTAFGFVYS